MNPPPAPKKDNTNRPVLRPTQLPAPRMLFTGTPGNQGTPPAGAAQGGKAHKSRKSKKSRKSRKSRK